MRIGIALYTWRQWYIVVLNFCIVKRREGFEQRHPADIALDTIVIAKLRIPFFTMKFLKPELAIGGSSELQTLLRKFTTKHS